MAGDTQLGSASIPIRATLDKLDKDMETARGKISGALERVEADTKGWSGRMSNIMDVALGFATSQAVIGGIQRVGGGIRDMVMDAVEIEQTNATFERLVELAGGDVPIAMDQLRKATRGMVGDADLAKASNKFLVMGLADTSEEAANLAEIATQLGSSMGEGATYSMENFAMMLANQSIPRLDSFGISSGRVRERIDELMKADKDLTREQAFLTATMEEAEVTMEKVGEQGEGVRGNMARMEATMDNLRMSVGGALLPVLNAVLEPLAELAQEVGPMVSEWGKEFSGWLTETAIPAIKGFIGPIMERVLPGLQLIGETIMNLAGVIFPLLGEAFAFVTDHSEIFYPIIGALAAAFIALNAPIVAVIGAIVGVAAAWEGNFLGIRDFVEGIWDRLQPALQWVWSFIQENVMPILEMLWENYLKVLGAEVEALSWAWENVLWPALQAVWGFIDEHVLPLLKTLGELILNVIIVNVKLMAHIWETVLWPALKTVWEFIDKNVLPIFQAVADHLRGPLGDALTWIKNEVIDPLIGSFKSMWETMGWILDRITAMITGFNNMSLPDWLTPGSPTPLETGIRGIESAMRSLNALVAQGGPTLRYEAPPQMLAPSEMVALGGGGNEISNRYYQLTYRAVRQEAGRLDAAAAMRELELYGRLVS